MKQYWHQEKLHGKHIDQIDTIGAPCLSALENYKEGNTDGIHYEKVQEEHKREQIDTNCFGHEKALALKKYN